MVKPLTQRREFTSYLDNLLSYYASPEGSTRRNLTFSVQSHVLDELFVNIFNLKVFTFDFHLGVLEFFDVIFQLSNIIFVKRTRNVFMLLIKGQDTVEDDMQLFRNTEFLPTSNRHFLAFRRVGISQTLLKVVESELSRDFDLSGNTTIFVTTEIASVSDQETVRRFDFDFELFAVDFCHALDFSKSDGVSIVETVLLFFMETDEAAFFLSDSSNMYNFSFFSSGIKNWMMISKIDKSEAIEA